MRQPRSSRGGEIVTSGFLKLEMAGDHSPKLFGRVGQYMAHLVNFFSELKVYEKKDGRTWWKLINFSLMTWAGTMACQRHARHALEST